MDKQTANDTLLSFIKTPLDSGDEIFEKFKQLPDAVYKTGENPLERYLYVPGKAKNRVLVLAHTDTVWDRNYIKRSVASKISTDNGVITNSDDSAGIGADDRAGCAVLWLLKESGHSLLLLDGEEHGHHGALYLQKNKKLMKEINRHSFILQVDFWDVGLCKYHFIKNPKAFKKFVESNGYTEETQTPCNTDVAYICKKAAGVNVSAGYKNFHRKSESISFDDFYTSFEKIQNLLSKTKRKYRIPFYIRFYFKARHIAALIIKPIFKFLKSLFIKK